MTNAAVLVLLATRLRSRAPAELVEATYAGLGGQTREFRSRLAAAELVDQVRSRGEEQRWSLSAVGEAELAAHLAVETDRAGRADLVTAYEAFLALNREFLGALSADAPLETLEGLVARLGPILDALASRLERFSGYQRRFAAALVRAVDDPTWRTSPSVDSVHTIWFELHEHVLATLGRTREGER